MKTLIKPKKDKFGIPDKDGIVTANWLNGLGEDSDRYTKTATIGKVRKNWLNHSKNIEAAKLTTK